MKPLTVVVGLCGPAGSGKSAAARYLARVYGARTLVIADPLKELLIGAFPEIPRDSLWGTQEQKQQVIPLLGLSGRALMQRIGDGYRSAIGPLVQLTTSKIAGYRGSLVVVEDVRFAAEASALRAGFQTYIVRLNPPWLVTGDRHTSEAEWRTIECDAEVSTETPTLDSLHSAVDRACAMLAIKPELHSLEAP